MTKKYLIYGGTGAQGSAVARALLERGAKIRVLTRAPERNPFNGDPRVEAFAGDLNDAASLYRASVGVDGVYFMLPATVDGERAPAWGRHAIDAAAEARVGMVVFNTSSVMPEAHTGVRAIDVKLALEAHLRQTRVPSVTLRTTLYLGNLAAPWSAPALVNHGVLAYPLPESMRVSWISWEEAAAYAAAAFERSDLAAYKPTYQTGGPSALNGSELAAALARVIGRAVRYVPLPLGDFEAGLNAALGAPIGSEVARFYAWLAEGRRENLLEVDLRPVRAELPVAQIGVEQWAAQVPWASLAGAER